MPLTTSLPAASIKWTNKQWGPVALSNPTSKHSNAGFKLIAEDVGMQFPVANGMQQQAAGSLNSLVNYQGVGAGHTTIWNAGTPPNGRGAVGMNSAANNSVTGGATVPVDWCPQCIGTPTLQNPGSKQDASSLVAVYDFNLLWEIAGASPMDNFAAGIWFLPYNGLCTARSVPMAALLFNDCYPGFGLFLNNVAGVAAYEYVSWHGDGAGFPFPKTILEQVPIPVGVAPSVNVWNSFRFIIIGATNTQPATLQVLCNDTSIVPSRIFGSALLEAPETAIAPAPGFVCGFNTAGTANVNGTYHVKLGRFTPGGSAIETE